MKREEVIQAVKGVLNEMKWRELRRPVDGICGFIRIYSTTEHMNDELIEAFTERYKKIFPNDLTEKGNYYSFGVSICSISITSWVLKYSEHNETSSDNFYPFYAVRIKFLEEWLKDLTSGEEEIE
jgi:flagellar biosynthesis regulator FlaF